MDSTQIGTCWGCSGPVLPTVPIRTPTACRSGQRIWGPMSAQQPDTGRNPKRQLKTHQASPLAYRWRFRRWDVCDVLAVDSGLGADNCRQIQDVRLQCSDAEVVSAWAQKSAMQCQCCAVLHIVFRVHPDMARIMHSAKDLTAKRTTTNSNTWSCASRDVLPAVFGEEPPSLQDLKNYSLPRVGPFYPFKAESWTAFISCSNIFVHTPLDFETFDGA